MALAHRLFTCLTGAVPGPVGEVGAPVSAADYLNNTDHMTDEQVMVFATAVCIAGAVAAS